MFILQAMAIFIMYPWAALLVAAALAALYRVRRRRACAVAAALWVTYCGYEYLMYARVLCTGECNIRVDLLLIYPLLAAVTMWAVVASIPSPKVT